MDESHNSYWKSVMVRAESDVDAILGDGDLPVSVKDALDKDRIETPEDWDELLEWCIDEGILRCDMMRLVRCMASWMQAWNELMYKKQTP